MWKIEDLINVEVCIRVCIFFGCVWDFLMGGVCYEFFRLL